MAISIKNVENPVIEISRNLRNRFAGRTNRRVFFFLKKWDSMTMMEITVPMAVARPAPKCSHITGKDKEIISEYIKDTACQNPCSGQGRVFDIPQISRQRLCKQKAGNDKLNWQNILSGQSHDISLRTEKLQQRLVKKSDNSP